MQKKVEASFVGLKNKIYPYIADEEIFGGNRAVGSSCSIIWSTLEQPDHVCKEPVFLDELDLRKLHFSFLKRHCEEGIKVFVILLGKIGAEEVKREFPAFLSLQRSPQH